MEDLQDKIIELMDLFDEGEVTTADKIGKPEETLRREMFQNAFKLDRTEKAGGGMLVQPSADGSRPGYAKDKREITTKVINKLDLDKKKITLNGDDFITGEVKSYAEGSGKKYVDEYVNFANKNYLKNDMSMVEPFQAYIKNKYPKRYAKIISDVNQSGYRNLKSIHTTYKRALANELITAANNQLKFVNQMDILKKLVSPTRAAAYEKKGGLQARPPEWADKNTLNNFKNLDKMENKLSKALTYMVENNVTIIDPKKVKITGSGAKKPGASPIRLTMHYLVGGGSEEALEKALKINPWYQSQNFKVGNTTRNTFDYLSRQYGKDFVGQPFNTAYDFALQRRGRIKLKGMSNQPLPENLIWEFAARSAQRNFNDGVPIDQWPVKILDKKGIVVDLGKFPVDSTGRKILNTSELQFEYNDEIFNRKNLKTKGVESGFFNDIYKVSSQFNDYLTQEVPDPDNPKKTISLRELFQKTEGRIFPTIGHDDARGGVKKRPFNSFKILTNVENLSLYNAYDKITNPETRKKVVNFIYGETKGLRGDRYKQAWTNKNVNFVTEYIKTGQGLEQTPYKQAVTMPPQELDNLLLKFAGTITDQCAVDLTPKKEGGRIGFKLGSERCLKIAKQGLDNGLMSGFKNKQQVNLAETILRAGGGLKSAFALRNIFGPAAIAATVAFEGGLIGYDMLTSGKTLREAFGDNLLNYALGKDYQIDPQEEMFTRFKGLGYNDQEIGSIKKALDAMNTLNTGISLARDVGEQTEALQKSRGQSEEFMIPDDQMMADTASQRAEQNLKEAEKKLLAFDERLKSVDRPGGMRKEDVLNEYFSSGKYLEDLDLFDRAKKAATVEQMQSGLPRFTGSVFPKFEEKRIRTISENLPFGGANPALFSPVQRAGGFTFGFAGGGIAKLAGVDQGPPPESGPNSQGLQGLMKRVKNI